MIDQLKITVTKLDDDNNPTDDVTTYHLSKNNWAKRWACMDNEGRVHCWLPDGVPATPGVRYRTSSRLWEVKQRRD